MHFFVGLDLGQTTDYTAVAVLQRQEPDPECGQNELPVYALRHLERFLLGTSYTAMVSAVRKLLDSPQLRGAALVVDQTGVGRPVVDMLKQVSSRLVPVTITAGKSTSRAADGGWHVPKRELVTTLQRVLQSRRLLIAQSLPDARVLVRELRDFQVRITASANEVFGNWRGGQHDDLVLAVSLACWFAELQQPLDRQRTTRARGVAR